MNLYRGLLVIVVISVCSLFLRSTYAYFVKSASSTGNTFTAAEVFPSTTDNPTATPTSSLTPTVGEPTITPTPTIGPGDVVINEINWAGSTISTADEWIELKNLTANPINLANWVIENLGESGTPNITITNGTIPASGFFLVSNNDKSSSHINIDPDLTTTAISLSNSGEQLILKNDSGSIIDSVNNLGTWFAGTDASPHKSMERNSPPLDGAISTNWHTATISINLDVGSIESASPKAENN